MRGLWTGHITFLRGTARGQGGRWGRAGGVQDVQICRGAMGIAMPVGAHRPVGPSSFVPAELTPRPSPDPFADFRDCRSGCFSNQHWRRPLRTAR